MMPICAFLAASSSCLSSRSIVSSSSLISIACGTVIGVRPVNSYFAASSSISYLSPSRSTSFTNCRANARVVVAVGVPDPLQVANLLFFERPAKAIAQLLRRADLLAGFAISVAGRFLDGVGFVRLPESSACAPRAPPSAIRASAPGRRFGWGRSSPPGPVLPRVSSRSSPKASMCSNAGVTISGGGCVGLGNRFGSYRWYV